MKADKYRFDGSRACDLRALSCDGKDDAPDKDEIIAKTAENLQKMAALQDAFYRRWARRAYHCFAGAGRRRQGRHGQTRYVRSEPPGRAGHEL